jgi:hypothetical protein
LEPASPQEVRKISDQFDQGHAAVALVRAAATASQEMRVVRRMSAMCFSEHPPARRSLDRLRGIEGARVRKIDKLLAQRHGVRRNQRGMTHRMSKGRMP